MTYRTLMVYVEADGRPEQRVRLAASLADQFTAKLIGLSALAIPSPIVANGMVLADVTEADIDLIRANLADKGDWFRTVAGATRRQPEWRPVLSLPIEALSCEARSADLVIIGQRKARGGPHRALDPAAAILKVGRPALVVPEPVDGLQGEHVVIGWKDTREARRAICDALPILQQATRITIVEACGPNQQTAAMTHLTDVADYLAEHRIKSGSRVLLEQEGSGAAQLIRVAQEERADLLITGAYGHSRLGEWIFGGMTRELLATSPICCLMSH